MLRRSIRVTEHGKVDVLKLVEEAVLPAGSTAYFLGPAQVVVKHRFAGINFIDTYFRAGVYSPLPHRPLPFIPGSEGCGVVVEAGAEARELLNKRVTFFSSHDGSYTTSAIHNAADVFAVPDAVPDSALPLATTVLGIQGLTAQYLTSSCHNVGPATVVLLNGAAGGTGLLIGQLARARGAKMIIGIASGPEKCELAKKVGKCDVVIDRAAEKDWVAKVKEITNGAGVDVFYDGAGKSTFEAGGMSVLKRRGDMVTFGNASGVAPPIAPLELTKHGSITLQRPRLNDFVADADELRQRMAEMSALLAAGKIEAPVTVMKLEQAAEAQALLETGKTTGKMLLECE